MRILLRMKMVNLPEAISSSALNTWIFNEDTIKQVLTYPDDRMDLKWIMVKRLGKTIIFAKNHDHAEKILEVFR